MSKKLFSGTLRQGSTGGAVDLIALVLTGSEYDPQDKIKMDSEFTRGGAIAAAVKLFQTENKLEATGDVDAETLELLHQWSGFRLVGVPEGAFSTPTVFAPAQPTALSNQEPANTPPAFRGNMDYRHKGRGN